MTILATLPREPAAAGAGPRRTLAVGTVLAAMAMVVVDAGATNVALPSLSRAFAVVPATAIRVVMAYQAGVMIALLPLGAVGERFGHRRVFILSVAVFAAAAGAAALAPGFWELVAARFVQGLGGGGVMALGVALLRFTVPKDRLSAAIGWNALTVALASAVAPGLGALVLAAAGWRGLFALSLPVAILTLATARSLPPTPCRDTPLDPVSLALNAATFALLLLAAQTVASAPGPAAGVLTAALLALALLVRRETPKAAPLLPLDLLRRESLRLSLIASVCAFAAQSAGLVALPFLLQERLHQPPLATGLFLTAWPLSVALAATVAGRLADRLSTAWLCALGCAALSLGLAGCGAWPIGDSPAALIPFVALAGFGFGLFQSPNNRNMFLAAPAERSGATGGLQGTARVSGQTLGALMMALLLGRTPLEAAVPIGLCLAAALALVAGAVSLRRILS